MKWEVPVFICTIMSMCVTSAVIPSNSPDYKYQLNLDSKGRYHFEWSVDYSLEIVHVRLKAKGSWTSQNFLGTGGKYFVMDQHPIKRVNPRNWFAIGFSDYGELTNADLVTFWTDQEYVHHFVDSHTEGDGILQADQQQDYHVTAVKSIKGGVVIEFYRLFDTGDIDDYQFDNGTTHLVYIESVRQSETPFECDVTTRSHGLQRAQILKPDLPEVVFPDDTWTFDVVAPEVLVPAKETTYWWHTTILPSLPSKHHIIKYAGIISEGSEDFVHHMEVFHCETPPGEEIPFYNGPGLSEGKPKGLEVCRKVIGAWAMGAQPLVYPEEAGVPVGGPGASRFALLEVHYNNPTKKAGHMDRSGIRFYVTSQLRHYEAGIMELGLEYTNKMAIPPRQKEFQLSGYCVSECTKVGIPSGGIKVFASQLHTHLTGKKTYSKHFRHGRELPELNRDNHYSPHYQEIRPLAKPVVVLPGDMLVHTCVYDTSARQKATIGGFSISDEMCVNYIHYYPKTDLEVCKSSVETRALNRFFDFINYADLSDTHSSAGYRDKYTGVDWNPVTDTLLEYLYATSPISMQCNKSNGNRFEGNWGHIQIPVLPLLSDTSIRVN